MIQFFKSENKTSENKIDIKNRLPFLIEELKDEKKKFIDKNLPDLKKLVKGNFKNLRVSTLNLVQYDWNENTQSNILQYFLDYNSFEEGAMLLCDIIKNTSSICKDDLCKKIFKKKLYD